MNWKRGLAYDSSFLGGIAGGVAHGTAYCLGGIRGAAAGSS
jgi:hypothetical protein